MIPAARFKANKSGPPLVRQRMNKSSDQSNTPPFQVTAWSSDGTYPSNIVSNNMIIKGSGNGTLTATLNGGTGNGSLTLELRIDGTAVATSTNVISNNVVATLTYTGFLGDLSAVSLWAVAQTVNGRRIRALGSYVEIVPS